MRFSIFKKVCTFFLFFLAPLSQGVYAQQNCNYSPSGTPLPATDYFLKLGPAPDYRLMSGGKVFNYPSVNIWDLFNRYTVNDRCGGKKYLHSAAAAGFKSARFAVLNYNEASEKYDNAVLWKQNPQAYFSLVDQMISDAREAGIYLIPSLVTGVFDKTETAALVNAFCNTYEKAWFQLPLIPGSNNRADAKRFVSEWASRYANEKAILFWELGNEINLQTKERNSANCVTKGNVRDFIDEFSGAIKSFDGNHLVASGTMQEDDPLTLSEYSNYLTFYNNSPSIDIVTLHIYNTVNEVKAIPQYVSVDKFLSNAVNTARTMKKALWLGEYGKADADSWDQIPLPDFVQSIHLARAHLGIDLMSAWNWDNAKYVVSGHPEQIRYSINVSNIDAISGLTQRSSLLGLPVSQKWDYLTGDFNGDGKSDIAARSDRGLFQVALTGTSGSQIPSQWLSKYGDKNVDAAFVDSKVLAGDWNGDKKADLVIKTKSGQWHVMLSSGASFVVSGVWLNNFGNLNDVEFAQGIQLISGDWNADGKADIGFKTRRGDWYVALSTGNGFATPSRWLAGWANENGPDLNLNQGVQLVSGDWNGDKKTDVGFKTKDGRWYVASSDGTKFSYPALWLTGFGNESGSDTVLSAGTNAFVGDWDGDSKTDIGFRAKDGRWYVAFNRSNQFTTTTLWHTGLGNEYSTTDPGQKGGIPLVGSWSGTVSKFAYRTSDGRIYINYAGFPSVDIWEWLVK